MCATAKVSAAAGTLEITHKLQLGLQAEKSFGDFLQANLVPLINIYQYCFLYSIFISIYILHICFYSDLPTFAANKYSVLTLLLVINMHIDF